MNSQREVWNNIAEEWHKFKISPSETATKLLNESKGKILDFGSGSGRNLLKVEKSKERKIYLVDFSSEMLKLAKKRAEERGIEVEIIKSDLEKIPFDSNFFDAAICVAAIHCLETPEKRESAIKEIYRVLKPNAKAEIEVWNKNSPRFKKSPKEKYVGWTDKGKRYYYLYEEEELKIILEKTGFKMIEKIPHSSNIIFIVKK